MKIGIDASFIAGERSGISVYTSNLINQIANIDQQNQYVLFPFFFYHFKDNYHKILRNLPPKMNVFGKNIPPGLMKVIWGLKVVPKRLYLPRVDVFHATTFTIPPRYLYKKLVVTIYDTTFYSHPLYHHAETIKHCTTATMFAVENADTILAISENTKTDLIKYFNCPSNKIIVTPLACGDRYFKKVKESIKQELFHKYSLTKPYILHLGSLEPRKNTLGLIKAFLLLPERVRQTHDLVIFGGQGWLNNNIIDYIKLHNSENNIRLLGYIANDELPSLYQSAKVFAYPSFYEGFGIPPLEAMASGCPTLVSNISSLPEVCNNGTIYCNPYDIEDISQKLLNMLFKEDVLKTAKAKLIARQYSWKKTAQATLKAYAI